VEFSGPDAIDNAIQAGLDLDGSPIPSEMLTLYRDVMDKENARKRSGVKKSMRNRIVKTGSKHFDQDTLNTRLIKAGWDGLKAKEIDSRRIRVITALAANQGLKEIGEYIQDLNIYCACIDPELISESELSPGIGDPSLRIKTRVTSSH